MAGVEGALSQGVERAPDRPVGGSATLSAAAEALLAIPFVDAVAADMGARVEWAEVARSQLEVPASDDASGAAAARGGGGGAAAAGSETVDVVRALKATTPRQRVVVVPLAAHVPVDFRWVQRVCRAGYGEGIDRLVLAVADEDSTVCYYQVRLGVPSAAEVNEATEAFVAATMDPAEEDELGGGSGGAAKRGAGGAPAAKRPRRATPDAHDD